MSAVRSAVSIVAQRAPSGGDALARRHRRAVRHLPVQRQPSIDRGERLCHTEPARHHALLPSHELAVGPQVGIEKGGRQVAERGQILGQRALDQGPNISEGRIEMG